MSNETIVHLLRHGEVHNPDGVLYGRRDGFHLSELGVRMAEKVAGTLADRDITHVRCSPLERAQQTAAPLLLARGLEAVIDDRVIESTNKFEGEQFGAGRNALRKPSNWRHLWNPFKPSWGEPYTEVAARMMAAVRDAREAATGHEAVDRLPPAADLDHPAARRGPLVPPRPAQAAVHPVLAHLAALRRRPGHQGRLQRARRRPDPDRGQERHVLRRRSPRGEAALTSLVLKRSPARPGAARARRVLEPARHRRQGLRHRRRRRQPARGRRAGRPGRAHR